MKLSYIFASTFIHLLKNYVTLHVLILDASVRAIGIDGLTLDGDAGILHAELANNAIFGRVNLGSLLGKVGSDGQGVGDSVIGIASSLHTMDKYRTIRGRRQGTGLLSGYYEKRMQHEPHPLIIHILLQV